MSFITGFNVNTAILDFFSIVVYAVAQSCIFLLLIPFFACSWLCHLIALNFKEEVESANEAK